MAHILLKDTYDGIWWEGCLIAWSLDMSEWYTKKSCYNYLESPNWPSQTAEWFMNSNKKVVEYLQASADWVIHRHLHICFRAAPSIIFTDTFLHHLCQLFLLIQSLAFWSQLTAFQYEGLADGLRMAHWDLSTTVVWIFAARELRYFYFLFHGWGASPSYMLARPMDRKLWWSAPWILWLDGSVS